jgi:hypothetical protein
LVTITRRWSANGWNATRCTSIAPGSLRSPGDDLGRGRQLVHETRLALPCDQAPADAQQREGEHREVSERRDGTCRHDVPSGSVRRVAAEELRPLRDREHRRRVLARATKRTDGRSAGDLQEACLLADRVDECEFGGARRDAEGDPRVATAGAEVEQR